MRGWTRSNRLFEVVEYVARGVEFEQECVLKSRQRRTKKSVTYLTNRELYSFKVVEAAGIEPIETENVIPSSHYATKAL